MVNGERKCKTCVGKYEYKPAGNCRYCKYNIEDYFGRLESKMVEDNYRQVKSDEYSDIPY